ncbi:sigma-54 interaction domain-containing protein [Marinobacterium sedimentorum]|uniref:sigma-54 interaction domain-containing protein n=1 Tax=Marinobacterium sedimentorum TaxID=2927804 RepID=UPI0020C68E98|nr:sigma 54-interacting transcriptional regulator [Marinobacterium sedimentorum]MCP8687158.1 sigma 54-interacting transcriptional regulator [Marinobacterium sedimentorum]
MAAEEKDELGPIGSILLQSEWPFDELRLLANNWFDQIPRYEAWLNKRLSEQNRTMRINCREAEISSPIDYDGIYDVARDELAGYSLPGNKVTLNLTSGTPAMIATWLLLGKGVFDCDLVQTSRQHGLEKVDLPFDISLEYLKQQDGRLQALASGMPNLDAHFEHIAAVSPAMAQAVSIAKRLAPRDVPVIILGASGTGKEVIANAIHGASLRSGKPFIAVNCGAIPQSLIDSQLFGHKKGAFTGAEETRKGFFEEADSGTLLLDELGELPLEAQVKLLRALQQGEINRVGESKPRKVNVRVIAATHRDLLSMVDDGAFREDLFYRLAVGVIQLPSLKERQDDIDILVDDLMGRINDDATSQPGYQHKTVSDEARQFIKQQSWPGNVRELWTTLLRASIWSDGETIDAETLQAALFQRQQKASAENLNFDVRSGINIHELLDETKRHCILEALKVTAGQRTKAAKLLGLPNHQTLANWMEKLELTEGTGSLEG